MISYTMLMSLVHLFYGNALHVAVNTKNNFKGSIYMVFDYADHDLTGLMERYGKAGFQPSQVSNMLPAPGHSCRTACLPYACPQLQLLEGQGGAQHRQTQHNT